MEQEQQEIFNKLTEMLSQSGTEAIQHYANWFFTSAVGWIIVGLIIITAGVKWKFHEDSKIDPSIKLILKSLVVFIGLLWVGCNLPDLFSPQGIAIHQLIEDLRG